MNDLANELLTIILVNIEIDELMYLRVVNTRWQEVIESAFKSKRSLLLTEHSDKSWIMKSFSLEPKDFVRYNLKRNDGDRQIDYLNNPDFVI